MYSIQLLYSSTMSFAVFSSFTLHSSINYPTKPTSAVTDGMPSSPSVQSS